jgi:hypothetical protein
MFDVVAWQLFPKQSSLSCVRTVCGLQTGVLVALARVQHAVPFTDHTAEWTATNIQKYFQLISMLQAQ